MKKPWIVIQENDLFLKLPEIIFSKIDRSIYNRRQRKHAVHLDNISLNLNELLIIYKTNKMIIKIHSKQAVACSNPTTIMDESTKSWNKASLKYKACFVILSKVHVSFVNSKHGVLC